MIPDSSSASRMAGTSLLLPPPLLPLLPNMATTGLETPTNLLRRGRGGAATATRARTEIVFGANMLANGLGDQVSRQPLLLCDCCSGQLCEHGVRRAT
jgi:hypothetical protein